MAASPNPLQGSLFESKKASSDKETDEKKSSNLSSERLANPNLEYYDSVIELEKKQKLELGTLKASKRKLDLIQKSFSLRIGRILTLPIRALSKIRRN